MMEIGEAFKYQREIKELSQSQLARETGLSQQMISWWEAGKGFPSIESCIILADYYGISLDELVGRDLNK
ncbi:MAG: helix-turn-helix domain-containing protein [Clostridia bacterium]|nr:helix-turn-helix domain-containing protein [Clostridia bacterium]